MTTRHKVPVQARVLAGESVRSDRASHGAAVPLELPPCPAWLPKSAKKHWHTLGPELVRVGLLSAMDGDVFAMHCDNVARYAEVCEKLEQITSWTAVTPNGFEVQSAWLQVRNRLQEMIIKTAREFGLTPSARSSIKQPGPAQGDLFGDPAAADDPFAPRVS